MDRIKGVTKEGWHPKDRSFKQMLGRNKDPHSQAQDHVSRPLATLKDPDAFGPPPKNVNYHGGAAVPNTITPDRRGIGAPLSAEEIRENNEAERRELQAAEEAARKPAPPPVPYRVNTSGLKTDNLPKPPVRRLGESNQSPASPGSPTAKTKPSLPPRLPPRQGSIPATSSPSPPPPYSINSDAGATQNDQINQGAIGRLGSAGISVPGFGIGSNPPPAPKAGLVKTTPADSPSSSPNNPQLSELQSRFSKLATKGQETGAQSQGTTLAEKQAAVKTAQSFRNDPSSISMSDARNTAATANNFRERHGDQVSAGWKSANALNKKHDVANRVNSYTSHNGALPAMKTQQSPSSPVSTAMPLHKRAPPPPPQKPSFSGDSVTSPPPVPLSSKPRT